MVTVCLKRNSISTLMKCMNWMLISAGAYVGIKLVVIDSVMFYLTQQFSFT
jgi:hypothetical protein